MTTMYWIAVTDYEGNERTIKVMNPNLVRTLLPDFMEAIDVQSIDVINGSTGEVLFSWKQGKLTWLAL